MRYDRYFNDTSTIKFERTDRSNFFNIVLHNGKKKENSGNEKKLHHHQFPSRSRSVFRRNPEIIYSWRNISPAQREWFTGNYLP